MSLFELVANILSDLFKVLKLCIKLGKYILGFAGLFCVLGSIIGLFIPGFETIQEAGLTFVVGIGSCLLAILCKWLDDKFGETW